MNTTEPPIELADIFNVSPRIIHPAMLEAFATGEFGKIISSPAPGLHVFPLYTEDYCAKLIEVADATGRFQTERGATYAVPELRLNVISKLVMQAYVAVATRFILPVIDEIYLLGDHFDVFRVPFICRYSPDTATEMGRHHDAHATLSLAISLNDGYEGGAVYFNAQDFNNRDVPVGYATMFPSMLTHEHEVLPITGGERYSLTCWLSSTKADRGADEAWVIKQES